MKKTKDIVSLALKAIGLAMGVAVTVLLILNEIDTRSALTLLAVGVAALGLNNFAVTRERNGKNK